MPTVPRAGPYRPHFYSNEADEPPHIHVDRDDKTAKFWLNPILVARNQGFAARELRLIVGILKDHEIRLIEAWHEHFEDERW